MLKLQLTSVTIGTSAPRALAAFYARLLSGRINADEVPLLRQPPEAGWAQVRTSSDFGRIMLNFEYDAEWQPPVWPSEPEKQHITQHLDILVDDLVEAMQWATQCGATLAEVQPQDDVRVMIDPHGHPFCLFVDEE